jgi:hypothetical protein
MASFDDEVLEKGLLSLQADRMRAQAEYNEAQAEGNPYTGHRAAEEMANIDARAERLVRIHRQSQPQPQSQQVPQSPEELRVKPAEKMTWQDGLDVAINGSKYGKGLDFNDPNVQRGYAEVMRKRQAGENQR